MTLFIKGLQPFSLVEEKCFKDFVHELNPNYELPSRHCISHTTIPAKYVQSKTDILEKVTVAHKVCVTTDCWTASNNEAFMAVTAHFVNENFELKSYLLECINLPVYHTSVNLVEQLRRVASEWGIQNTVLLAVSDIRPT